MEIGISSERLRQTLTPQVFGQLELARQIERYGSPDAFLRPADLPRPAPVIQQGPEIDSIPATGLEINQPGRYYLTADIHWQPARDHQLHAAIRVTCADVQIDLAGYRLHIEPNRGVSVAILVETPDLETATHDIEIINGDLSGHCYAGVMVDNGIRVTVRDCTFHQLHFDQTALPAALLDQMLPRFDLGKQPLISPAPIIALQSLDLAIHDCEFSALSYVANTCAGIFLMECAGAVIHNCRVDGLSNRGGVSAGYFYMLCADIHTTNCLAHDLHTHFDAAIQQQLGSLGHTCIGYMPTASAGLTFSNCASRRIHGCCDDCHGMSVFIVADVTVSHFSAHDIRDGFTRQDLPAEFRNTGAKATGLEIYGTRVTALDCSVSEIYAKNPQDLQSAGFSIAGSEVNLINCLAQDVKVVNDQGQPAYGEMIGYGVGFGWAPDPRSEFVKINAQNVRYLNCRAHDCQAGFDSWNHCDCDWLFWQAEACAIDILQQGPDSIRTLTYNGCSECRSGNCEPTVVENRASNNSFMPQPRYK